MILREAREEDVEDIREIASLTWEGHDYLAKVFHSWVKDGGFFVIEEGSKVVATAKLTSLPCNVAWFEGLRVHPDYRGRGYAKTLHEHLISLAREEGFSRAMFATYFKNWASIHLAEKYGFRMAHRFHNLMYAPKKVEEPIKCEVKLPDVEPVPMGWRFLYVCEETLSWLRERVDSFCFSEGGFFVPKDPPRAFTPFSYKGMLRAVNYMGWVAERMGNKVNVLVPEGNPLINELFEWGFRQWEGRGPDVYVFSLDL